MMFCVPTPYSIQQDPDDGEDVFESIIPSSESYYAEKRAALWARFHDTGLGNSDKTYWKRAMNYRYKEIKERYDIKFRVFSEYKARLAQASSVDLSDGSMESESVNKVYDPPEVSVAGRTAEDYLADQNKTEFNQKTFGGLEPETVREYMDAVSNPAESFAREFDKLFYWGL
jgi:hypothetical protein